MIARLWRRDPHEEALRAANVAFERRGCQSYGAFVKACVVVGIALAAYCLRA
jgi:hypothetical protein